MLTVSLNRLKPEAGEISAEDQAGEISAEDQAGEISAEDQAGEISAEDQAGEISAEDQAGEISAEEQASVHPNRNTTEQIFNLGILYEKCSQHQKDIISCLH